MNIRKIYPSTSALTLCVASLLTGVSPAAFSEEAKVSPYRPTISNPAGLSEPGWLELESGVMAQDGKDGSSQRSLPYLAKFAVTPDFGILLGGDAYLSRTENQTSTSGTGDTLLMLKQRYPLDEETATALGCEYGFKAPTATSGLGSGKRDYVFNGILSSDIGRHTFDVNLNVTKLGDVTPETSAYQYGWAGTVFHPVGEQWGVMAELSGSARQGTRPQNQWLVAASYAWNSRLVLDTGFSGGISGESHRAAWFAGMAALLGKVR